MDCPNCGVHIGRFELDQNCKNCGVNLFYIQQEKLLAEDAKRCELEFASFRILVTNLKTAFIKGKLVIARLVLSIVCVCVLLIPFGKLSVNVPLAGCSADFSGLWFYQLFSNQPRLSAFMGFTGIEMFSDVSGKAMMLAASVLLLAVVAVALLVTELLSFIKFQRGARAMAWLSGIGVVFSLFSILSLLLFCSSDAAFSSGIVQTSLGYGSFAALVSFGAMMAVNIIILKKKIAPVYKEVDLQRIEMRKRVKRGEVSLDDLPLPVFESEEEREARTEAEQKDNKATAAEGGSAS